MEMMLLATTVFEDLQAIPLKVWMHIGVGILVIGVVFIILMRMSKIIITLIALGIVGVIGYQWFVLRNEPEFLTPMIEMIRPYSPVAIPDKPPPPVEVASLASRPIPRASPPPLHLAPVQTEEAPESPAPEKKTESEKAEDAPMVVFPIWEAPASAPREHAPSESENRR